LHPLGGLEVVTAEGVSKGTFRVLVVEDNPHVSEIFSYAFRRIVNERLGRDSEVEVEGAADGYEAWNKLEQNAGTPRAYDLVILDLMLPVLDGVEVLRRIRANPSLAELPVLVVTAGDDEACAEAKENGATAVLRKPVQFAQIRVAVAELL